VTWETSQNGTHDRRWKIFISSDHAVEARKWVKLLQENTYLAKLETDLKQAIDYTSRWIPDLVILDFSNSFKEILQACKTIRSYCPCPILILTSDYTELQVLDLFAAGANECIPRPTNPSVVLARARILLNPGTLFFSAELSDLQIGQIKLYANENKVLLPGGKRVSLTNLEFRLLHLLMSRPGSIFAPNWIVSVVWGMSSKENTQVVKHVISRLRRKIETDPLAPQYIGSIPGKGYYFITPDQ
jgi:two-component system response regulator MtrA